MRPVVAVTHEPTVEAGPCSRFALAHERFAAEDAARSEFLRRLALRETAANRQRQGISPNPGAGRPRRMTDEQVAEARAARAQGETFRSIAKRMGLPSTTVRYSIT
jgi:hypothetical protein